MPWFSTIEAALASHGLTNRPVGLPTRERWAGEAPVDDVDEEARAEAAFWRSPRYLAANQALERWHVLALLDSAGLVVEEVRNSTDLGHILRSRPDTSVWIPCGEESGVSGWALTNVGSLVEHAKEDAAPPVPDEPAKGRRTRDLFEARATAVQVTAPVPSWRSRQIGPGDSLAQVGREFLAPPRQKVLSRYCWSYPAGWEPRPGATGVGLKTTAHVPADGSIIADNGGTRYAVSWSYCGYGRQMYDCPPWLLPRIARRA